MKIACIGAAHFDVKAKLLVPFKAKSSHPVTSFFSTGGVIRNVAENLARLSLNVQLVSRVGADARGSDLLQAMRELGIDVSCTSQSSTQPTATYTAVLDSQGELIIGLADMEIYDEVNPSLLGGIDKEAPYWFVDSSFSVETLRWICLNRPKKTKLWAMAISPTKVVRWKSLLSHLDLLFLNRYELERLVDVKGDDLHSAAALLVENGPQAVIVTEGEKGAFVCRRGGHLFSLEAHPVHVVDVTGAGDALAAGTLFGVIQGFSI